MDNAQQIRRIQDIFSSLGQIELNRKGIKDTLNAIKSAHVEELRIKPEPPPLKLEAGCRVHMQDQAGVCLLGSADLLHVDNDKALIIDSNGYRHLVRLEDLTVIEAATPEVGDYVSVPSGSYRESCFVTIVDTPIPPNIWYKLSHRGEAIRDNITILHKAPKEG